ncbi:hypothetical protein N7493_001744 [Penicillium malachiteum]|uniref:Uncharacterized protein n=1 Tax=Penicillium malachiteum TaxID=1324776 RepID=A0AAD6MZY4_9EURO|nr:hypothetical protein N7493_001744 [Penicillium malachiteum]
MDHFGGNDEDSISSFLSALIGLGIAIAAGVLVVTVIAIMDRPFKTRIKRLCGRSPKNAEDVENNPPGNPHKTLSTCIPVIETEKTIPGHAISDMDRDIKFQIAQHEDLKNIGIAITRKDTV